MGPLAGLRVIELGGIGPGPMCAMLLADLGATVLRIDRKEPSGLGTPRPLRFNLVLRNRPSLALDLKRPAAIDLVLRLVERANALIEGFRPGVMERLGLGPGPVCERNERLVYGRMSGWGQDGPLAQAAGHDLNFVALTGALHSIGRQGEPPTPPLNLVGDYGGGALYLAFGIMCALFEAAHSGRGQVVDAAIVDGTASLMTNHFGMLAGGQATEERGTNSTDSGAYFYDVYRCADGRFVSIAAVEAKFHAELLLRLGVDTDGLPAQWDKAGWPRLRAILAERFVTRTRDEWCALLECTDVCFAPVLAPGEAPHHRHLVARKTFIDVDGVVQPAPAPRFSRSVPAPPTPPRAPDATTVEAALVSWLEPEAIAEARRAGAFA